jgi:excisionase family DNA binding protein
MALSDDFSARTASELCGREDKLNVNISEGGHDARVSLRRTKSHLTVREAAKFLGVSQQTVYLWVERKQVPHLRVMGRNIRFLKSELVSFRGSFNHI